MESDKPLHATTAWVTSRNTPESDRLAEVQHTVRLSDGSERTIFAPEPGEAIRRMNVRLGQEACDE